jgi:hypothetical protein
MQPEESCPLNHNLHHEISFLREGIISAARNIDYNKDDVFLPPPKKKDIKHLIGIIEQLIKWKKDWHEYYLNECCAKKIKVNQDITKGYKSTIERFSVLDLDILLHQSRVNIKRFNNLYQQTVEDMKICYEALIIWEDRLSHCDIKDESECESVIELTQSTIEDIAERFEKECNTLISPIDFCVEMLGPKLQKLIEDERQNILRMRKMILISLGTKP